MRPYSVIRLLLILTCLLTACVDPEELDLRGTVDVVVVDGTVTNLTEIQSIRLNHSKADPLTGRFGTTPITKATVEVVVDSVQVIACHETIDGTYQLPSDFKGQVGHAYQLRFHLADGTQYASDQQVMPAVPPIARVQAEFNATSLSPAVFDGYTAAYDFFVDVQDPADQHNYYRWDWKLWEKQNWCRTCTQGVYAVNNILPHVYKDKYYFVSGTDLYENCFTPPVGQESFDAPYVPGGYWYYDYQCRTPCWEILYNYQLNVFDDIYSNGGLIQRRKVGQIPFYSHAPCLVDIRQNSLTRDAYQYYKLFQEQTERTGSLVDTPPAALVGNVTNVANAKENVVGYFTASAVALNHHWLDRKDAPGTSLGATKFPGEALEEGEELFASLNSRRIKREPPPPYAAGGREVPNVRIWGGAPRPPFAPCLLSDNRTPFRPEGWQGD